MQQFIIQYWVEALFALLLFLLGLGYRRVAHKIKEQEQVKDGILAILHDRLYQLCQYYINQGDISPSALKNIEYLYRSYHTLGGNGTGTELYDRVKKLPITAEQGGTL